MRNFYNQPTNKIFDKMFGKGARQIQADPTTDLTQCKCCQCDTVECKACLSAHVLTDQTSCCHSKNSGLIFQYERPQDYGAGMQCCPETAPCCPELPPSECGDNWDPDGASPICRPPKECLDLEGNVLRPCSEDPRGFRRCCGSGKEAASPVRFYYNYIGQYFKFQYGEAIGKTDKLWPNNGKPRLCSFCDPTSVAKSKGGTPSTPDEAGGKCLDYYGFIPGVGIVPMPNDDGLLSATPIPENQPCHYLDVDEIGPFYGCQCMGVSTDPDYLLRDQNRTGTPMYDPFRHKKMSAYRRRQMEKDPYYRWLADIMCYDGGNRVLDPVLEYYAPPGGEGFAGLEASYAGNGTLFDHLLAVVHCEHWYELARCPQNPEHGDEGGILGGWIRDPATDERIGINQAIVAPRFWIYACSGVPLFDFEVADALKRGYINAADYEDLMIAFAAELTPNQEILKKLAQGGYFDVGDWRQEALNEIQVLKGLSYTKDFYSGISGSDPNFGACCIYAPPGATSGLNATCRNTDITTCGLCGGNFFANRTCSSDLCVSCDGFKPHRIDRPNEKYLGPVRKRMWIPENYNSKGAFASPGGIGIVGVSGPARLDPKKARKNIPIETPELARGERIVNPRTDPTLFNLQLPEDLIKEPWTIDGRNGTRVYPQEPPPNAFENDPLYEEWRQFVIWRDSQWLYMHARPGGWDYVCSGYYLPPEEGGNPLGVPYVIPDLPRRYSTISGWPGGCLAGLYGVPRKTSEYDAGCPNDIQCGYTDFKTGEFIQYPLVGCGYESGCVGIDCFSSESCKHHPEKGGGGTPCIGVAVSSSCDGMRWVRYRHKVVKNSNPDTQSCFSTYVTCAGDTINSYLYTVNKETGNFGDFCPHSCRNLTVPKRISNAIPRIYSNRAAHNSVCEGIRAARIQGCSPFYGKICPGLYCNVTEVVGFVDEGGTSVPENGYWYGPLFTLENYCCGPKTAQGSVGATLFGDSTHNAASCRRLPGPGYPALYDGKFVGESIDPNPQVCCWYCPSQPGMQRECLGTKTYYECLSAINDRARIDGDTRNTQSSSGVGFFYNPEDLMDLGRCCELSSDCGCASPAERNNICPPMQSGDDSPPPPDGSAQ